RPADPATRKTLVPDPASGATRTPQRPSPPRQPGSAAARRETTQFRVSGRSASGHQHGPTDLTSLLAPSMTPPARPSPRHPAQPSRHLTSLMRAAVIMALAP